MGEDILHSKEYASVFKNIHLEYKMHLDKIF